MNGRQKGSLFLLFACLVISYALLISGYDTTEGLDDYKLARNIVRNGALGFPAQEGPIFDRGPDGRFYLAHEIGNPLAMTPAVAGGELLTRTVGGLLRLDRPDRLSSFLACFNSVILVALLVTCMFWIWNCLFQFPSATSLQAAIALGFGTMLFPYTKMGTDLVLTSLLVVLSLAMAWSLDKKVSSPRIWAIGFLLSYAFITRPTASLFVPGILGWAIYVVWNKTRRMERVLGVCTAIGLPLLAALFWQGWYNHLRTGDYLLPPMLLPRYAAGNTFEGTSPLYALMSILASPGKSIFVFSPVLVFGLLGFRAFWRKHRAFAVSLIAVAAPYFVFHFLWKHWSGHWGWGPRLHLPLVALIFVPAVFWLQETRSRRMIWTAVLIVSASIQVTAIWNNWQARTALLIGEGTTLHQLTWSLRSNVILDGALNIPANLERMYGLRPWHCLEGSSPLHCRAANTIDIWWANLPVRSGAQYLSCFLVAGIGVVGVRLWAKLASRSQHEALSCGANAEYRRATATIEGESFH